MTLLELERRLDIMETRLQALLTAEAERQGVVKALRIAQTLGAIVLALLTLYAMLRGV